MIVIDIILFILFFIFRMSVLFAAGALIGWLISKIVFKAIDFISAKMAKKK